MRTILHLSLSAVIPGFIMLCPALSADRSSDKGSADERRSRTEGVARAAPETRRGNGERKKPNWPSRRPRPRRSSAQPIPQLRRSRSLRSRRTPRLPHWRRNSSGIAQARSTRRHPLLQFDNLQLDGQGGKGGGLEFKLEPAPPAAKPGVPIELQLENFQLELIPQRSKPRRPTRTSLWAVTQSGAARRWHVQPSDVRRRQASASSDQCRWQHRHLRCRDRQGTDAVPGETVTKQVIVHSKTPVG